MPESIGTLQLQRNGVTEQLHIARGWTADHRQQIVDLTVHDAQVCKLTDDPSRFADMQTLSKWLSKRQRFTYVLLDAEQKVVGSFWIAHKQCEQQNIDAQFAWTLAIRLYGKARGAGLAVPFMQRVLAYFVQTRDYLQSSAPGFWLRTKTGNVPARKTYEKFGFSVASQDTDCVWMTWLP